MNQEIEKYQGTKEFSPHYVLEMSLVCKNCGTAKGRWVAASDGPTSFDFILTTCEYCGCFRFEATLYAKFYEKQDKENVAKHKSKLDSEIREDLESKRRQEMPLTIKNVKGERIIDRDESNSELAHSRFDYELRADAESDKRLREQKTIKKVEGELLCPECGLGVDCVCATEPDEVKF